jgi:hypothetical protein
VLPEPAGCSARMALQEAVGEAAQQLHSVSAKLLFKSWALTPDNAATAVGLMWFVVASAFQPDHPHSDGIKVLGVTGPT